MQLQFQHKDNLIVLDVEKDGEGWRVRLPDGTERRIVLCRRPDDVLQIAEIETDRSGERAFRMPFARTENGLEFSFAGASYTFTPATRQAGGRRRSASGALTAPMVGTVADVLVQEGQRVEAYQPLVIIEAMKVMTAVEAPFAGIVKAIHVQPNQRVTHGEAVAEVSPLMEAEE
ncbi:MAG TPA: biotin/lipoyl-containing protein [Chthonomonadaceae bacterium]|nr:biotin/lipoyl-containing protein [Chthonomonadaceae bacterium]